MINFAFFLELYKLYDVNRYYDYDEVIGFRGEPHIENWLKIIKSDEVLQEQILMGFQTMKTYSKEADKGLREDLEFIIGKDYDFCEICSSSYIPDKKTTHSHIFDKDTFFKYMKKINLLSRTNFEYELEFQRNQVIKFDRFFKL